MSWRQQRRRSGPTTTCAAGTSSAARPALAGLAGMATRAADRDADRRGGQARRRASRSPSPRNMPIDTFVVLMMENRSFDHYFGWHPNADGKNAGLSYPDDAGQRSIPTHRLTPDFQGCDFRDPDHAWDGGRYQYNGGKLDGFYRATPGTGSDEYALGYYLKADLPFIPHAAAAYHALRPLLLLDHGLDLPQPPLPVVRAGRRPEVATQFPHAARTGFEWETIFDRAHRAGPRASATTTPTCRSPALYGQRGLRWVAPVAAVLHRRRRGQAAATSPSSTRRSWTARAATGISGDEHPHGDIRARPGVHVGRRRTRSSSRRSTGAARCSSTTTSGAASSTTSSPATSPTTAPDRDDLTEDYGAHRLPHPRRGVSPLRASSAATSAT